MGLGLCGIEFAAAQQLGYDPMRTVVPLTALAWVMDRYVVCVSVCVHIHIHAQHTHTHTHTCMCVCVCVCV